VPRSRQCGSIHPLLHVLILVITKNIVQLFVISDKKMSQYNMWILFLFRGGPGRTTPEASNSVFGLPCILEDEGIVPWAPHAGSLVQTAVSRCP
jgi:hypothetical protein